MISKLTSIHIHDAGCRASQALFRHYPNDKKLAKQGPVMWSWEFEGNVGG
jgi:hypothetical protein